MLHPRTWGCFFVFIYLCAIAMAFPTHVGVFLPITAMYVREIRLPHARGGVSERRAHSLLAVLSSPRTWGVFPCAAPAVPRIKKSR